MLSHTSLFKNHLKPKRRVMEMMLGILLLQHCVLFLALNVAQNARGHMSTLDFAPPCHALISIAKPSFVCGAAK
jgi:hypothetical protein